MGTDSTHEPARALRLESEIYFQAPLRLGQKVLVEVFHSEIQVEAGARRIH